MGEIREDPTTGEWVVFAPARRARPHDAPPPPPPPPRPSRDASCPFCPGNESMTPPEIARLRLAGSDAWQVRAVPNRYPIFGPGPDARPGPVSRGVHEVLVETPDHAASPATLRDAEIELLFDACHARVEAALEREGVETALLFHNEGERAGASLVHPHSQLVAAPRLPPRARRRIETALRHRDLHGSNLYSDLVRRELDEDSRVLFREAHVVALHPYASRWPYETWVLPLEAEGSFLRSAPDQRRAAARATRRALRELLAALGPATPYNVLIETVPARVRGAAELSWHVEIAPRLATSGGFELGSGTRVNPVLPEEAARHVKAARREH